MKVNRAVAAREKIHDGAVTWAAQMARSGSIDRWMELELKRANAGIVSHKKKVSALLKEEKPHCETRDGRKHEFDVSVLRSIAAVGNEVEDLLLPVTIYFLSASQDSCYVDDEVAASILRRLEGFGRAYPFRDGKMWLPNSLAFTLMQKYPTAFQGLFL